MSGGMLAGIIGGIAAFLVLVFVALGVIVYFASVPADRSTPRTDVVTSQSPSERMVSPPQGITPPLSSNALPQLSDINGGSSALKLEFQSGEKYDYFYSLKTRVNERQIEIGGMNALRIISGLRHNTAAGGDAQQIEYSAILTDRQLIGTQINSSRGKMELAQNGAAFDVYENEQTSLPILLVDIGMIGIERLETTRPSWSHEEKISVARVEEQVTSNSRDFMYRYRPYGSSQKKCDTVESDVFGNCVYHITFSHEREWILDC